VQPDLLTAVAATPVVRTSTPTKIAALAAAAIASRVKRFTIALPLLVRVSDG
jgi:hypothetical protein